MGNAQPAGSARGGGCSGATEDEEGVALLAAFVGLDEVGDEVELCEVGAGAVARFEIGAAADEFGFGGAPGVGGFGAEGAVGGELPAGALPIVDEGVEAAAGVVGGFAAEAEGGPGGGEAVEFVVGELGIEGPDAVDGGVAEGETAVVGGDPLDGAAAGELAPGVEEIGVEVGDDGTATSLGDGESGGGADEAAGIEHEAAGAELGPLEEPPCGFGPADVVVFAEEVDPPGGVVVGEALEGGMGGGHVSRIAKGLAGGEPRRRIGYAGAMAEQYAARDTRTGLEVAVTGDFPPHPDDRIRIARTTTLFTRLMSTILSTPNETERRERFLAIETQLELADALIRQDMAEVQRLMRQTLERMGITPEQMDEMARKILEQLRERGDFDFPPGVDS